MTLIINRIFKVKTVIITENNVADEHFHDFLYNFISCFLSIFICLNVDFLQNSY